MKKQPLKYRLNVIGGALIIFLLIRSYLPYFAAKFGLNANYKIWIPICTLTLILCCVLPIFFIENMCDFHPDLYSEVKKKFSVKKAGIIIAFSMFMLLAFNFVNSALLIVLEKFGVAFAAETLPDLSGFAEYFLYFIFSVITPAFFEELFIRYLVLNLLKPYGRKYAVLVSSAVFMLMHAKLQSFPAIFGAGVTLACVYLYCDDIRMSMRLHRTNNAYSFFMQTMSRTASKQSLESMTFFMTLVIISLGIASTVTLKKENINIYSPLKSDEKGAKAQTVFSSPVFVLAIIGCCMTILPQFYRDMVR